MLLIRSIPGFQLFGLKLVSAYWALKILPVHTGAFGKRKFVDEVKFRSEKSTGFRSMTLSD